MNALGLEPGLGLGVGLMGCRAKVQIGAMLLCKGAKVRDSFRVAGGGREWALYVVTRSRPYLLFTALLHLCTGASLRFALLHGI